MVEMDVGHRHASQLRRSDADLVQCGQQDGDRRLAAGLDQDGGRALNQVAGGDALPAAEQGVDLEHALGDAPRRHHRDLLAADRVVTVQRAVPVVVQAAHAGATSTTTLTSSGWRVSASCQCSSGTRRLTTRANQARSALASAAAAAS